MEAKVLEFRHCTGCGAPAKYRAVLVALPGHIYVCEDCVETMCAIVATEAPKESRIKFVDNIVAIMRQPIEITTQWKALSDSKDGATK